MPYTLRERVGVLLERIAPTLALRFTHVGPTGRRVYVNRVNGFMVTRP